MSTTATSPGLDPEVSRGRRTWAIVLAWLSVLPLLAGLAVATFAPLLTPASERSGWEGIQALLVWGYSAPVALVLAVVALILAAGAPRKAQTFVVAGIGVLWSAGALAVVYFLPI